MNPRIALFCLAIGSVLAAGAVFLTYVLTHAG